MPLIPIAYPQKWTKSMNIGKEKNSGFIISAIQNLDNVHAKIYFSDPNKFLATSTAGFSASSLDVSSDLISNYPSYNSAYQSLSIKPYLLEYTRPYQLAGSANAQLDVNVTMNLIDNDTIRIVYKSNYTGANATVKLASDLAFANNITFAITGTATPVSGIFTTIATLKISSGTLTGTPDLTKIITARIIGVNQTASNIITPVVVYVVNSNSLIPGEILRYKVCCTDEFDFTRELKTAELKCGQSTTGETATEDKFMIKFTLSEESADIMALSIGSFSQIKNKVVWEHVTGYEAGNTSNGITSNKITLGANSGINSVSINCATLQEVSFIANIATNPDLYLGTGQYSYDPATGNMWFNTVNNNKNPEVTNFVSKAVFSIEPEPLKLGYKVSIDIQDINADGKIKYYRVQKAQIKFPNQKIDEKGNKQEFELVVFFSKKGDVEMYYSI